MNKQLRRFLLGGASLAVLSGSALAADMPVKAPPAPAAPVFSWTGFYAGLHAGGGWANDESSTVTMQRFTGAAPGVPHPFQSGTFHSIAFPFGGAQIGYNWQLQQRWVVGLEADISGSWHNQGAAVLAEGPLTDMVTVTRGLDWFGTARGRVGYLVTPQVLAYATGGLAYGRSRNDFTQAITGPGPIGAFTITNTSPSISATWTAGGGVEYALDPRWSVKLEYDYLAFRNGVSSSTTIMFNPGKGGNTGVFNVNAPNNGSHTVQLGLNYHFWN